VRRQHGDEIRRSWRRSESTRPGGM
jgi:hypothetical protein